MFHVPMSVVAFSMLHPTSPFFVDHLHLPRRVYIDRRRTISILYKEKDDWTHIVVVNTDKSPHTPPLGLSAYT